MEETSDDSKYNFDLRFAVEMHKIDSFLRELITADQTWFIYGNVKRKRLWSNGREPEQTVRKPVKKCLICVWW